MKSIDKLRVRVAARRLAAAHEKLLAAIKIGQDTSGRKDPCNDTARCDEPPAFLTAASVSPVVRKSGEAAPAGADAILPFKTSRSGRPANSSDLEGTSRSGRDDGAKPGDPIRRQGESPVVT